MVFLIQNTQNRDSLALHLKLDEIIRAMDKADDELIRAEDESEEDLTELKERYREIMLAQRKLLKHAVLEHMADRETEPAERRLVSPAPR
jgi:low affinity Fe/Cu permease